MKYKRRGSNQYQKKTNTHYVLWYFAFIAIIVSLGLIAKNRQPVHAQILSPLASSSTNKKTEGRVNALPQPVVTTPAEEEPAQPTELEEIVAYITRVFEPEGKDVVVRAINCFYSESGLRPDAVGQNKDAVKSTDHGVAQLNSYWHKLTEEQKTDFKANIDKAYEIYKGRGHSFSAWYGKLCQ